jgi:D-glycerate 3-kinase
MSHERSPRQGCGKTTLTNSLCRLFGQINLTCAVLSLDDLYLTYADQQRLALEHPDNPLLQYRGNGLPPSLPLDLSIYRYPLAGTHDLELASRTLDEISTIRDGSRSIALPRYDKSQHGGRGDRAARETWPVTRGPFSSPPSVPGAV